MSCSNGGLRAVAENRSKALPNFKYFIVPGSTHTMLYSLETKSRDVELGTFLTQQASDSASWANVAPF